MRIYIREKILEIIDSVFEGIKYIQTSTNAQTSLAVLGECYQCLLSIDNSCKNGLSENKYLEYNKDIENIKENLERVNENLQTDKEYKEILNTINFELQNLKNKLTNEEEVKVEIVFLPYKASMWDCFDTIWKKANEDPRCDAYVISIGYFDKDSNGNLAMYHNESSQFPDYVTLTDIDKYNISMRKPDIIYIHNPYESYNYVTSVPPIYYAEELKKHTNMLVYIPYFVAGAYKSAETAYPYVATPVLKDLNYIVYQSNMQLELLKQMGLYNNNAVVLGTPKLDAFCTLKECEMPNEEWGKIKKYKKTILFATTLVSMLALKPGEWIRVVKNTIDNILSYEDFALIWRPHPLLVETIKSMRPMMYNDYMELLDYIKNNDRIIIDENKDCKYSFAHSDAMIVDNGSLILQYIPTGKPVLMIYLNDNLTNKAFDHSSVYTPYKLVHPEWKFDDFYANPNFEEKLDVIQSGLKMYCDMLLEDKDISKDKRMEDMKNSVANCDGTAGEKIHEFFMKKILP